MYRVRKREGKLVSFDVKKIKEAIRKAFEAEETKYNEDVLDFLVLKVTADFEPKIKNNVVTVVNNGAKLVLQNIEGGAYGRKERFFQSIGRRSFKNQKADCKRF